MEKSKDPLDPGTWTITGTLPKKPGERIEPEELSGSIEAPRPIEARVAEPQAAEVPDGRLARFAEAVALGEVYREEVPLLGRLSAVFRILRLSELDAIWQAARRQLESLASRDVVDRNLALTEWSWRYRLVLAFEELSLDGRQLYRAPGSLEEWRKQLKLSAESTAAEILEAAYRHLASEVIKTEVLYTALSSKIVDFSTRVRQMEEALEREAEERFFRAQGSGSAS